MYRCDIDGDYGQRKLRNHGWRGTHREERHRDHANRNHEQLDWCVRGKLRNRCKNKVLCSGDVERHSDRLTSGGTAIPGIDLPAERVFICIILNIE